MERILSGISFSLILVITLFLATSHPGRAIQFSAYLFIALAILVLVKLFNNVKIH